MRRAFVAFLLFVSAAASADVILFRTPNFPTVDAPVIADATMDAALRGFAVRTIDDLRDLKPSSDVLILPYGSAFPIDAWPQLRDFIKYGGSLIILGGAPLHQPVIRAGNGWKLGTRQPTFAHELLIGPAEEVRTSGLRSVNVDPTWSASIDGASRVWEMTIRLATKPNTPNEQGAEGDREGVVRPLVHLVDAGGLPRACPLLAIDRLRGASAGARWIFAPTDAPLSTTTIHAIVERALEGAVDIDARPVQATIAANETARIRITAPGSRATLVTRDDRGTIVDRDSVALNNSNATFDIRATQPLAPGLYHVEITTDAKTHPNVARTAFWVRDAALLARGPKLTVSRDWIRRDGKVFPIIGTTYMASDVHRQFLFEPNPEVWDRDFAEMQRLGINFVRTGLWTEWARAANEKGEVNESVLRALEAYVQTAAKHDIVVCFTFFAFLPPAYGGSNPYLDPKSLAGQTAFVTSVARRFRGSGWIHYDLINEPSYAPLEKLWTNQPMHDEWEKRAWIDWVRARYGDDTARIRDAWQDPSDNVLDLPADWEVWPAQVRESRRPRKVFDFVLFTNDVVAHWAERLRSAIRDAGGDPLVTLGQDEGGVGARPSQQLHDFAVDYTSIHPWWQNDDVYSTGVFTKVPEKPLLFQETGLMRLEDVSGFPWRTPQAAASFLQRKYAYGFAARAAGVVEWAWNINPYMPIDNESVIGFFRPDGTAKPELDVVPKFAKFFRDAAPRLDDYGPDPVVVVIPQSRLFMNRPNALDGFRRIVRVLAEHFSLGATAISDLRMTPERLKHAKLVIVASTESLMHEVDASHVLYIGANGLDPDEPVQFREAIAGGFVTFDRNLQESVRRSTYQRDDWHEPLPLEFAQEDAPLVALLDRALRAADVRTHAPKPGQFVRVLEAPRATVTISVNEVSGETNLALSDRTIAFTPDHASGIYAAGGVSSERLRVHDSSQWRREDLFRSSRSDERYGTDRDIARFSRHDPRRRPIATHPPQSFYDALPDAIKKYPTIGDHSRDTSYFLRMYLGDYRAVEYLATRPEWDGSTMVVTGTSMGGQQSFAVAGLNRRVTALLTLVPSGSDVTARLHGRAASYPFWNVSDPDVLTTARYFDPANFASRITARSLVAMGFIDEASAPAGIWSTFNQIRGPKEAVPLPESPHNHLATPEQLRPWTVRSEEWLAALVRGEIAAPPARTPAAHSN